ncbi:MAG: methylmalonyl Co-A mutase-associated GTPase MeaB [Alphaproteobacteria bacterium]|jgi:LAO/AO transport system ATPase|nr:methylmalonyl Co-A mutase-associated GTPase MeaB [Alphaproteobacteria bacterium]MDP6872767.1 methylmalonyl Co-A mutase-associated GTPase MeaB [Alphaproteobacteria bacterium]
MRKRTRGADYYRQHLLAGERVALARAITAVENDSADARAVFKVINGQVGRAHVIGFTGAPGAGKSSLVNSFTHEMRKRNNSVGVIAVDPSSPFTGGAILGDRIRMSDHGGDDGVFVRSLASRGHLGGLSRATARVVDIMDAAGKDVIIVETVGTGQSEVEIMEIAQTVVVVCAPGLGDEIQAVKAGILEIANILVVNKFDLPHAERTARHLKDAVELGPQRDWPVPIMNTIATDGEGIAELADMMDRHYQSIDQSERENAAVRRMRKLVATAAARQLNAWLDRPGADALDALCEAVLRGEMEMEEAGAKALDLAANRSGGADRP